MTMPPLTLGYCFKAQNLFSFFIKKMSPTLCISGIDFLFGIDHLTFLNFKIPLKLSFFLSIILKFISSLLTDIISAKCHFKVGSSL